MAENLQLMLDDILKQEEGRRPRLLLHSCCGPCSSYVLEYLAPHFDITVDYYNPNIDTAAEYAHRAAEQARLVEAMGLSQQVEVRAFPYQPKAFFEAVRGLEDTGEGAGAALPVTGCGWPTPPALQRRRGSTTSPPPCPSAPTKTPPGWPM